MRIHEIFHAVKSGAPQEKTAFWSLCKATAANDAGGVAVGLTKIAFEIWADAFERGFDPGRDRATREAFAGSFGSASAVDATITKMAQDGRISEDEQDRLSELVAESAVRDLEELTKEAGALDILKMPQVIGAIGGAVIGAGIGAWKDEDNRTRGALAGMVPGALLGAVGGQGVASWQGGQAQKMLERGASAAKGRAGYDVLLDSKPSFGKVVKENKDKILKHFAQGNTHVPEFLEQHIAKPSDRSDLRKALGSVFGGAVKKSALQQKYADILQGLEQGGQPPMNANQLPAGSLEGGPEGMPASTSPNAQGGEGVGQVGGIEDGALDGHDRAQKTIDNMIFLAQQVQLPQLAQELDQKRDQLAEHFASGHAYLPPELQHNFAQSEHAEAFMKKYKQRFGSITGTTKKIASFTEDAFQIGDRLRGLAPGGVDMREVRRLVPGAVYGPELSNPDAGIFAPKQPGFLAKSDDGSWHATTWDPETARKVRSDDPDNFYPAITTGMREYLKAHPAGSEQSETPKVASFSAHDWSSWRLHH